MSSPEESDLDRPLMAGYWDNTKKSTTFLNLTARFEGKRPWRATIVCLSSSILGLLLFTAVFGTREETLHPSDLLYSPAQEVLEYETRTFSLGFGDSKSPFQGPPSPELDNKWSELYDMGIPSLVPLEIARKLPNKTVIFPHDKERRYLVTLDVFHQLHCLNMIRMALHPDYYRSHASIHDRKPSSVDEELLEMEHIDHCIDSIRQSLTCNADISVLVWKWDAGEQRNVPQAEVSHTCRKFDKIQEWARERSGSQDWDDTFRELNDPLDSETWTKDDVEQ